MWRRRSVPRELSLSESFGQAWDHTLLQIREEAVGARQVIADRVLDGIRHRSDIDHALHTARMAAVRHGAELATQMDQAFGPAVEDDPPTVRIPVDLIAARIAVDAAAARQAPAPRDTAASEPRTVLTPVFQAPAAAAAAPSATVAPSAARSGVAPGAPAARPTGRRGVRAAAKRLGITQHGKSDAELRAEVEAAEAAERATTTTEES